MFDTDLLEPAANAGILSMPPPVRGQLVEVGGPTKKRDFSTASESSEKLDKTDYAEVIHDLQVHRHR